MVNQRKKVSYGLSDPLINVIPEPIVSTRDPLGVDKAQLGQTWVNSSTNSFWVLTSIVNNVANWESGGGSGSITEITGDAGVPVLPALGNINILADQGGVFTGAGDTLTLTFVDFELGNSGAPLASFSLDGNSIQSYVITTGGVAGTSYKAILGDLTVDIGDGTASPQAIRGNILVEAPGHTEEAYAGFFSATERDGATIDSNMIGVLGSSLINSTMAAMQPQQWIAGSQSIVSFDAAAAAPTATIVAANLNHVTYDPAMNTLAHGVVVSRNGAGAGGTAAAAYKVVNGGAINDWAYGLDLANESLVAGNAYSTADIRLWNTATILSAATGVTFTAVAGDEWNFLLGDAAGVNSFAIRDSANALACQIFSNGQVESALDITSLGGDLIAATPTKGVILGSTAKVVDGVGDPNTVVTAPIGSLYLNRTGSGVADRAWINTDGGTTWTAISTVA